MRCAAALAVVLYHMVGPKPEALAGVGLFSYSLYLTHELVLMETWRVEAYFSALPLLGWIRLPQVLFSVIFMMPLAVAAAWAFFML